MHNKFLAGIGLISSNIPKIKIKNDAIRIDIIKALWFPNNINPNKKPKNIPIPPSSGVGLVCALLAFGTSNIPVWTATNFDK